MARTGGTISKFRSLVRGRKHVARTAAENEAATKIQAVVRGHRDRKKVDALLLQLIEELMASKESRGKPSVPESAPAPAPAPAPATATAPATAPATALAAKSSPTSAPAPKPKDYDDDDESIVEEEIIVVIDDSDSDGDGDDGNDHDKEETVVEIVTIVENESPSKAPRPKSAFEVHNEELKQPPPPRPPPKARWKKPTAPVDPSADKDWMKKPVPPVELASSSASASASTRSMADASVDDDPSKPAWMKRAAAAKAAAAAKSSSGSSASQAPPPKPKHKSSLVNRYLEAAAKQAEASKKEESTDAAVVSKIDREFLEKNETRFKESKRDSGIADVEADRARGRWKAAPKTDDLPKETETAPPPEEQPEEPPAKSSEPTEEDAAPEVELELEASSGDLWALSDAEELAASASQSQSLFEEDSTGEASSDSGSDGSGTSPWVPPSDAECEEYQESQGLPLWWMQLVPHRTKPRDEYEQDIRDDLDRNPLGARAIVYRAEMGAGKRKRSSSSSIRQKPAAGASRELPAISEDQGSSYSTNSLAAAIEGSGSSDSSSESDSNGVPVPTRTGTRAPGPGSSKKKRSKKRKKKKKKRKQRSFWSCFFCGLTRKSKKHDDDDDIVRKEEAHPVPIPRHKEEAASVPKHEDKAIDNDKDTDKDKDKDKDNDKAIDKEEQNYSSEEESNLVVYEDNTSDGEDDFGIYEPQTPMVDRVPGPEDAEDPTTSVTKIVVEHSLTSDVKIVVEQ